MVHVCHSFPFYVISLRQAKCLTQYIWPVHDRACLSEKKKTHPSWKERCDKPRQHVKKQRHHFANKDLYNQSYVLFVCLFFSSHVQMWKLDHKVDWVPKNWCFWIVVLKKTLESPLDNKEIKQINAKGNQPWIFIRRTDAEVESPIFRPPDAKS